MSKNPTSSSRYALFLLAALFVAFMCAGVAVEPPPLRAANTATQFDARAAQARLVRVLGPQVAHPIDSAAEDGVRDRLMREIEAIGLKPEIHEGFACSPDSSDLSINCGHVRNVVFSIGPPTGPAILAASHYDSVPGGPGATDDGIAIAVWLEVAAQLAHEKLHRRIVFLFSDGEELALLGADYFARHDPLMTAVTALVNLEARGTRGPAVFFESNEPNADAVNTYAAVSRPLANSILADVYHRMPNSTDVSVLTRPGLDVINIALLEGDENYHTPRDNIASQDMRSVQHMGDQATTIVRQLARAPDQGASGTLVYTDIVSRAFIRLPSWLSHGLLVFSTLVAFLMLWRAGKQGRWRALLAPVVGLALAAGLAFVTGLAFSQLEPGVDVWFAYPAATRAWCVTLGLLGVMAATAVIARSVKATQVEDAAFFVFALMGALLAIPAPGVSILFSVPMGIYAVGAIASIVWSPARTIGAALAGLATLILWAPLLHLMELALGYELPIVFALLIAVTTLPWLGIAARLNRGAAWGISCGALGLAALASIVATAVLPSSTVSRPHGVNLLHFSNAVTGDQRLVAGVATRALPKELTNAYPFAAERIFPGDTRSFWTTAVPANTPLLQGPVLDDVRVEGTGDQRTLHARIRTNGAYRVLLRIPPAAKPGQLTLNGVSSPFADAGGSTESTEFFKLFCDGRRCDGAELAVTLAGEARAGDWYVVGYFPGLIESRVVGRDCASAQHGHVDTERRRRDDCQ